MIEELLGNKLFVIAVLALFGAAVAGAGIIYEIKYKPQPDFDKDNIADNIDLDDDNDRWSDVQELEDGTNPKDPWSFPVDSDGDGLSDAYESRTALLVELSLNKIADENNVSRDLLDWRDYVSGIYDPHNNDTNKDGIIDGEEDFDNDGLVNMDEQFMDTDPYNNDTDSDSLTDGDEVFYYKSNPTKYDTDADYLRDSVDPIPDSTKKRRLTPGKEEMSDISPELALRKIDTDCYKLGRQAQRDSCFDSLAQIYSDPEYCKSIMDNTRKDSCLKSFGIQTQSMYQG